MILGSTGMLGVMLSEYLERLGHIVYRINRSDLQLSPDTKRTNLEDVYYRNHPDIIINLVANTNVDYCELNPILSFQDNCISLILLQKIFKQDNGKGFPYLIHISTDQVYDGIGPHRESEILPINTYAISKVASEHYATQLNAIILRTNFFGKNKCKNRESISDWLIRSASNKIAITLFRDVYFNPLSIETTCSFIEKISHTNIRGIFNLGSNAGLSKATFGLNLLRGLGIGCEEIKIGSVSDSGFIAPRPKDMRTNVEKIEGAFKFSMPSLMTEISKFCGDYIDEAKL